MATRGTDDSSDGDRNGDGNQQRQIQHVVPRLYMLAHEANSNNSNNNNNLNAIASMDTSWVDIDVGAQSDSAGSRTSTPILLRISEADDTTSSNVESLNSMNSSFISEEEGPPSDTDEELELIAQPLGSSAVLVSNTRTTTNNSSRHPNSNSNSNSGSEPATSKLNRNPFVVHEVKELPRINAVSRVRKYSATNGIGNNNSSSNNSGNLVVLDERLDSLFRLNHHPIRSTADRTNQAADEDHHREHQSDGSNNKEDSALSSAASSPPRMIYDVDFDNSENVQLSTLLFQLKPTHVLPLLLAHAVAFGVGYLTTRSAETCPN